MIREMGYCQGYRKLFKNFNNRAPGTPPQTLIDFFPKDFLMFIDESHVTIPQVKAMYAGDRSRKKVWLNMDLGFLVLMTIDH